MRLIKLSSFWVTGLLLMLAAWCCVGCGEGTEMLVVDPLLDITASREPRVHVIRPRFVKNSPKTVVFYGKFQPVQESRLQFKRPGIVTKLLKTVGESVTEGEVIAEQDLEDLEQQKSDTTAKLEAVRETIKAASGAEAAKLMAEIQQLEGQLGQLQAELAVGKLTADMTGTVVKTNMKVGATAIPGRSHFTIADKQSPVVVISLNSKAATKLADNQSIWVGHNQRPLKTSIQSRKSILSEAGAEQITLEFLEPLDADSWSYGTVVEVRYRAFEEDTGYWIPMSAVNRSSDGSWSVLVAEAIPERSLVAVLRQQTCKIARQQNDQVLVTGADLGDSTVVVDGSHRIVSGQTVVPIELAVGESGTFRSNDKR